MRVATFNVLSGRTPGEHHVDAGRFAAAVASLDADVLALQEVDRGQPRSGYVDLARVAAEAGGAVAHRFAAAMTGLPDGSWTPTADADPADRPAYGIALLSRHPVSDWQVVRLPPLPLRVPYHWPGAHRLSWVRDEQRVALLATVESPAGPLRVAATHLSFLLLSGTRQLRHLLSVGDRLDLLLGDLNMPPAAATRLTGMRPLVAAPTFPTDRPRRQIDHVLAGTDRVIPNAGGAVELPVSDHRALVVDLVSR